MLVDSKHRHSYVLSDALRILVIDDDPILREFACVYLSTPTTTIETAENGEAGLRRLRDGSFDFVLCDISMPGLSGFDVIREIRSDSAIERLPIIVITSNEDVASIDKAYDEGATSFVTKPINWRLLSYQIRFAYRASVQGFRFQCHAQAP